MDERRILPPLAPGFLLAQRPQTVVGGGRLGVYATFGACAGALPLPWVPDAMARSIRGALVHDIAIRHGVSLSPEARTVLAEPLAPGVHRGWLARATRFFGSRLAARTVAGFLPVGLLWPAHAAVRTYVLGRLFDRYLEQCRAERSVVLDAEEARRIRGAIEGALLHAVTRPTEAPERAFVVHDERGPATAFVDGLLGLAASVPDRLTRRVDMAFDERLSRGRS
jgi:hypothetical protein